MKRLEIAAWLLTMVLLTAPAFAEEGGRSVEGTLNYGSEAFSDLGGQVGITVGFGYEFRKNLQGRIDLSYYRSSTDMEGMDVGGTRVPIDLGVRYLYPLPTVDEKLTAYGQGGLEVSFDDWEPGAETASRSRTRVGAVIGAGAEYMLDPQYGALLNLQYHVIENSYFSAGIGLAYHF